jgi:calcineurin-like phosphoesterase family protein
MKNFLAETFRRLLKTNPITWFISDTHFGHTNVINYCNRPFATKEEMNLALIKQWNKQVAKHDKVYHLGDFSLSPKVALEIFPKLNGKLMLISGNHDSTFIAHKKRGKYIRKYSEAGVTTYSDAIYHELKNGELVVLSHLPYKTESGMKYDNRYNDLKPEDTGNNLLHGHLHGRYKKFENMIDVGWDAHNRLLSEDEIIALIKDPREFIESPLTEFYEKRAKENLPNAD